MIKWLMRFFGARGCAVVIITNGAKILLTKRAKVIPDGGKWCLPGGGMKKWERGEDAVRREIVEETGFKVKKAKFLFYQDEFVKRLNLHALVLVFLVEVYGKGRKNWEVSEFGWFSRSEIDKLDLAFTHKEILRRFFENES